MQKYWSRKVKALDMSSPGQHGIDQMSIVFDTFDDNSRGCALCQPDHELKAVTSRMGFFNLTYKRRVDFHDVDFQPQQLPGRDLAAAEIVDGN